MSRARRNPGIPGSRTRLIVLTARLFEHGEVTRAWMRRRWPGISTAMQQRDLADLRHSAAVEALLPVVEIPGGLRLRSTPLATAGRSDPDRRPQPAAAGAPP